MDDPRTAAQWQEAVDAAQGALELDSCRQYGLIKGGPKINQARCLWMLEEGRKRGITPDPDAGVNLMRALMEETLP